MVQTNQLAKSYSSYETLKVFKQFCTELVSKKFKVFEQDNPIMKKKQNKKLSRQKKNIDSGSITMKQASFETKHTSTKKCE